MVTIEPEHDNSTSILPQVSDEMKNSAELVEEGINLITKLTPFLSDDAPGEAISLIAERLHARAKGVEYKDPFFLRFVPERYITLLNSLEESFDYMVKIKVIKVEDIARFAGNRDASKQLWNDIVNAFKGSREITPHEVQSS